MEIDFRLPQTKRRSVESVTTEILRSRWLYLGVAATGLIMHLWRALPIYSWYDRLLAWVPLLILLVLLRKYVRQQYKSIPLLVLVALQIYIFFSLPQFSQEDLALTMGEIYLPTQSGMTLAMLLIIGGELMFILGFLMAAAVTARLPNIFQMVSRVPTPNWIGLVKLYSLVSFAVYTTATITVGYLPVSLRYLTTQLFNIYLALAILLYLGHTFRHKKLLLFAYVLAAGMSFVGLIQGMLGAIVGPLVLLIMARWVWGRIFDVRWALIGLLAIVFINPVKNQFRLLPSWVNPDVSSVGLAQERLNDWSRALEQVWLEGNADNSVYMSTASRASDLLSFSQAIDYVPDRVSYNEGEGMNEAVLFWIPRILWPEKGGTTDLIYNRYAVTFGYLNPEDVGRTAVSISVFAEGYWNFGVFGVILFLFASGVILGALFGNNGKFDQVSTVVCITYVAPVILPLQALSVTLAAIPSFVIGVLIALSGLSFACRLFSSVPFRPNIT